MPLVHEGPAEAAPSERQLRARKIRPRVRAGARWCGSSARATSPRRSSSRGCCSRRGSRACCAARPAFDVPDFMASGPRDVLVPQSGARGRPRRAARRRGRAAADPARAEQHARGAPGAGRAARARRCSPSSCSWRRTSGIRATALSGSRADRPARAVPDGVPRHGAASRARCARQTPCVWIRLAAGEGVLERARRRALGAGEGEADGGRGAALALEQVEDRAAEQRGVAQRRREARRAVLAQAPRDRRTREHGLARRSARPRPRRARPSGGGAGAAAAAGGGCWPRRRAARRAPPASASACRASPGPPTRGARARRGASRCSVRAAHQPAR